MEAEIDVAAFKDFERNGWESSVAGYEDYFGPLTRQTIPALLAEVGVTRSNRLLDVACGPGYVAAAAFALGCSVGAVDISEGMIALARTLCPAGIAFAVGDAEELPFRDREFDAVTMNFGILHLARPEAAVQEARRVLRPGGSFGFTVWSPPERSAGFHLVLEAIEAHGSASVRLPPGPPFFKYSSPEQGTALLAGAGFRSPRARLLEMQWKLPGPQALFDAFYEGTARTGGNLRAQPEENRKRIQEAVRAAMIAHAVGGVYELPMSAWIYVGTT